MQAPSLSSGMTTQSPAPLCEFVVKNEPCLVITKEDFSGTGLLVLKVMFLTVLYIASQKREHITA